MGVWRDPRPQWHWGAFHHEVGPEALWPVLVLPFDQVATRPNNQRRLVARTPNPRAHAPMGFRLDEHESPRMDHHPKVTPSVRTHSSRGPSGCDRSANCNKDGNLVGALKAAPKPSSKVRRTPAQIREQPDMGGGQGGHCIRKGTSLKCLRDHTHTRMQTNTRTHN
jgi:hypothetical protein